MLATRLASPPQKNSQPLPEFEFRRRIRFQHWREAGRRTQCKPELQLSCIAPNRSPAQILVIMKSLHLMATAAAALPIASGGIELRSAVSLENSNDENIIRHHKRARRLKHPIGSTGPAGLYSPEPEPSIRSPYHIVSVSFGYDRNAFSFLLAVTQAIHARFNVGYST